MQPNRQVIRKVVAANRQHRRMRHTALKKHNQLRRARANILRRSRLPVAGHGAARGGLAIRFGLSSTDERQWMTPVKSFIWAKDAAGIRGECIEMRNRAVEGC
jgi:hypothetical protein